MFLCMQQNSKKRETPVKYNLTEKDIKKICSIYHISELEIKKLNDFGLLNTELLKHEVIRQDYKNIKLAVKDRPEFSEESVLLALKREHHIQSTAEVRNIVNDSTNKNMIFCKHCGTRISLKLAKTTGGYCNDCMSEQIKL